MREAFGGLSSDWKEGINWAKVRDYRLGRAREAMKRHGLGALLLMYDENMRYVSATYTPGWNRMKPGLRYVVLCEGKEPIVYEQGDIGIHLKEHNPWIPPENIRYSYSWIKGAVGPAATQQVSKFVEALIGDLEDAGVRDQPLGVDFIDINMLGAFERVGLNWTDGMTPMMEARAIKGPDEQKAARIVGSICDSLHYAYRVPAARADRERDRRVRLRVPVQHPGDRGRGGRHRLLRAERLAQLAELLRPPGPAR
jgi:Xaa-Pro aminopeptidase